MSILEQHPYVAITLGTILVACGGLLATWGWNQVSVLSQRDNLMISVSEEWRLNESMVNDVISLARRWNKKEDGENFPYQPFKSNRSAALISSGVLESKSSSLVKAIEKYETAIEEFSASQRIAGRTNPGLFIKIEFIHPKNDEFPTEESELLSESFLRLLSEHRNVGNLLN